MSKYYATILSLLFVSASYGAKSDSLLTIPFGNNSEIQYHLEKGYYKVSFNANAYIDDAGFAIKGASISDQNESVYQSYKTEAFEDAIGKGKKYVIQRKQADGNAVQQVFYIYNGQGYFVTQLIVVGKKAASNYLSPLQSATLTFDKTGDNRALFVPFDNDMWVRYNAEKIADARFTSSEVTAVYNSDDYGGVVIGSLEHETWKSGISLNADDGKTISLSAFGGFSDSAVTHDEKAHGLVLINDSVSMSPKILIGYFKDWRKGMELYGKCNALTEPRYVFNWNKGTPIGWNSWGVLQDKLTLGKAKSVIDFFSDSCKQFRTKDNSLYIDLDAFWDKMVQHGISGNTDSLKQFVAYCNEHGFKPGIYWAPFTDWSKEAGKEVEGSNYHYSDCWTKVNGKVIDVDGGRAIDPTHPATKARIRYYINAFKSLGFKMIKIDFLAHATLEADSYFDRNVHTGMEAFKEGMEYLDKEIGNSMLIYAAISPNMATARYVHMRRIACDAFKKIDETAYTLNSTTYGWWLAKMYNYIDADHVVFDDVCDGENRARLAAAVVTGSLITGDDYSSKGKWEKTAKHLLQNKELLALVQHDGKPFLPVEVSTGKNASRLFVKNIGRYLYVAAFNYSNELCTITLPDYYLTKTITNAYDLLNQKKIDPGACRVMKVPARDVLLYKLETK